jgi:hypothetical protein
MKKSEKENTLENCIKCGKPADRRFSVESDHGFIFLCSSQQCYNALINDLVTLRDNQTSSDEKI